MSEPFVGEIKMWAMDWAPKGWALCNGATLPVNQNAALFSLIGTQFGGNGTTTFGLPDLRGRTPIGTNPAGRGGLSAYGQGASGGVEGVTLSAIQVPPHMHLVSADVGSATLLPPTNGIFDTVSATSATDFSTYVPASAATSATVNVALAPTTVGIAGGGGAHSNMQPFAVVNFTICMSGLYPSRP